MSTVHRTSSTDQDHSMHRIFLGAFEVNGVNLTSQGLWAHPDQQTYRYNDLDYWVGLARTLDEGGFDFLFFADSYGYPVQNGETPAVAFEQATEIPKNDPMLLIPALAQVTNQLNFAVTASTTYEAPYSNARRFATLDHLTGGRIAWNIVTTTSTVVADLFGRNLIPHDERYAIAAEHLEASYALFEGSWEDDAVVADKEHRLYAHPERVHRVSHHGTYFDVDGYFNATPSVQRTPVLFQAGGSPTGMRFAAANAEVVFLQSADEASLQRQVATIRQFAVEAGRAPDDITTVVGLSAVVGTSEEDAQRRLDDYLSYVNVDAARVYFAQMTGIDLAALQPDTEVASLRTEQSQAQLTRYNGKTAAEAFEDFARNGMREHILLGTGEQIAAKMIDLVQATGVDGFNFTPFVSPGSYEEFIREVVPELRRRGALPDPEPTSSFRHRLRGSDRLPETHPAAGARRTTDRNEP